VLLIPEEAATNTLKKLLRMLTYADVC
jgi:hypothetical protein